MDRYPQGFETVPCGKTTCLSRRCRLRAYNAEDALTQPL